MSSLRDSLTVKVFADCADFAGVKKALTLPWVKGVTTNPSLVSRTGAASYTEYARTLLSIAPAVPLSFEVFADTPEQMAEEARIISTWGNNVYVKIPVVNSRGESQAPLIRELSSAGIALNVTLIFTAAQCAEVARHLSPDVPAFISVFAGRIADAGHDPLPILAECRRRLTNHPKAELLWASVRELYNIFQADAAGCQVVTAPLSIVEKLADVGRDLTQCSIDGARAFMEDIRKSGIQFV